MTFLIVPISSYGLAMISRLQEKIGLFSRKNCLFEGFFAKETNVFMEPTSRSHLVAIGLSIWWILGV